jgi:voltage-gated potassium channel Kch
VDVVRRNFPNLRILARARNRRHAHLLMDRGIADPVRETFYSSLRMGEMALEALGVTDEEARRQVQLFAEFDERSLTESHAFYEDERQLIQSARQTADELASIFETDQQERGPLRAAE